MNLQHTLPDRRKARKLRLLCAMAMACAISACGGGDTGAAGADGLNGVRGADGVNGVNGLSPLVAVAVETPGSNCSLGGSRISAGADTNANGVLDAAEVTSIQYVCRVSGAIGTSGLASLIRTTVEPAGVNCPNGGSKITAGLDANANGVLDVAEVVSTAYVCQGSAGAQGATGASGFNSLMALVPETAGANCTYGGSKVTAGLDTNVNGVLDAPEVTSSTFTCDGAPGPGVSWIDVTAGAVQAQANMGYLADSSAQVVVTLPAAPAVGDLLRVSGVGTGGWQIAQNAGQSVITQGLPGNTLLAGLTWTPRNAAGGGWTAIASSADGSRLAAVGAYDQIYVSNDSGVSWTARESARPWYGIASSADGRKLVAAAINEQLYTSSDFGASWVARDSARDWRTVASSADGVKLVAAENNGLIYTSTDSGLSWTPRESARQWSSVASSANGASLVATDAGGQIYVSADYGVTWFARESNRFWLAVASSADGVKLVAIENGGQIYTSADSGQTWTPRDSVRNWDSVASSADGNKLVAGEFGGMLYTSTDSGVSWTARESSRRWWPVASSADGNKIVAAEYAGQLYTSVGGRTTSGSAGSVSGAQFDAIELQYVGGGVFMPLEYQSYSGGFVAR